MIDNIKKELCTGCNACFNICSENCIEMLIDNSGFRYPKVDYQKCSKCRKCLITCPSLNKKIIKENFILPKIFAAWTLDEETRMNSTSGGIFSELAKNVIQTGGLVVGAKYNSDHLVVHDIVDNVENIEKLRQSKYIQSDIENIYKKIKNYLISQREVAFCGSPCQVAGLLNYLGQTYANLTTFDFVCRGMNSPKAYRKYLDMLENKYQSKIKKVWFKNKTLGWNRFSTRIEFNNGDIYLEDRYRDLFMRGYIEENLYMRPCCFECKYKEFPRVADITLADFWGVANIDTSLDADKGTSLILINSKKGEELFHKIKDRIYQRETSLEFALPGNRCILESAKPNPRSEMFLKMLDNAEFDRCFKKYAQNRTIRKIKNKFFRGIQIIREKLTQKK